ncbi:hypothetical protein TL16_g12037 [Triparma laevis f. inornata]|uniref:Uncharacterized protein n=2 Tax=Triparma laevis TaxID=1534972 RepID=A0A9W7B0P6_9STRA|nr:hypothetical protein TrLO_g3595 [Triparma laevis f. longispina]GMH91371.1 hypothetical protein TL16_g12037 [Triparma laevis f. inornata]
MFSPRLIILLLALIASAKPLNLHSISRRNLVKLSPIALQIALPQSASAVSPINVDELSGQTRNLNAYKYELQRKKLPPPSLLLRPKINLDFAVLLMRASYQILDDFNLLPMNEFQRDFFLLRSTSYKSYTSKLSNTIITQGDLTDPYYFDYISYAQYATINRAILKPNLISIESQPVENSTTGEFIDVPISIRSDLRDDLSIIPKLFRLEVGENILKWFDDRYNNTTASIPKGNPESAVRQIINLFRIQGFLTSGDVKVEKNVLNVGVEGSGNNWSMKCLKSEKLNNDFIRMAIEAWGEREGNAKLNYVKLNTYKIS